MTGRIVRFVRDDDAQAVVELAVALPLVALMLLGLLQFGFVVNTRQYLEGVARQGARTFALTGDIEAARSVIRIATRQLTGTSAGASRARIELNIDPPDRRLPRAFTSGPRSVVAPLDLPPGLAKKLRGYWVEVVVTYDFPNPVQATVLGTRILPPSILLTTRAVARMEVDLR